LHRVSLAAIVSAISLAFLASCSGSAPKGTKGSADFSQVVYVGDSLTAGFQNGSLLDSQQQHGWAAVVAQQANYKITLPLIAPPGAPAVLQLISVNPLVIQQAPGITTGRDNPDEQATDLAVPGHTLNDLLNTGPTANPQTGEDFLTDLVLAFPLGSPIASSQAGEAIALKPTLVFVWIGNNDALIADSTGDPNAMTSVDDFTKNFALLMQGARQQTGAILVVGNIPDVTKIPYLTAAAAVVAEAAAQTGKSTTEIATDFGIADGDFVNATGMAEVQADVQAILANQATTPLTADGVLTAAEVTQVQTTLAAYNQVIASQAGATNAILVDIAGLFKSLQSGTTINGYTATPAFLGGLFSLDGTHPTNTGYALIANAFIDAMNQNLENQVNDVDVSSVAANDPLFGPNISSTGKASRAKHITLTAAKAADAVIRPKK
jgi:lysophospholipase L1-like esterase